MHSRKLRTLVKQPFLDPETDPFSVVRQARANEFSVLTIRPSLVFLNLAPLLDERVLDAEPSGGQAESLAEFFHLLR